MLTAAWGIFGGLIYLAYRPSEHVKLSDVERQVYAFEHQIAEEGSTGGVGQKDLPPGT
jgi:hypothetical protein